MMVARGARWAAVIGVASLAGCSWTGTIFTSDKVAYESAQSRAPLEVPPDLSQLPRDERFIVPDRPQTVTASGQIRPGAAPMAAGSSVVPAGVVAKVERQGNQRWLAVNLPPEKVWPVLVDFFPSVGLSVERSDAATGIVETVWAENRAKLPQDIIRRTLGRVLDSVYSTGEQDKFRARLERTAEGASEIYVSHRGMIEVYTSGQQDRTAWQPRPSDPDLEAEMLQRLLVKFDASAARTTTAATGAPTAAPPASGAVPAAAVPQLARLVRGAEGRAERVELDESFDRAWRRVGLALDRGGFTVEDRDRAKGLYFVRYLDPDYEARQKADRGFFSRIFGRERAVAAPQFRVTLTRQGDARTLVQVLDAEGKPERSATGERILTLLTEQLR